MKSRRGLVKSSASGLRALVALSFSLSLVGCSIGSTSETPQPQQPESMQQTPAPDSTDPEPNQPEIEVIECSQVIENGIETTINAQTASFAVEDFELAYSYASESFQSSVSLNRFIEIIQGSYGPLISSSTLSFDNCLFYPEAPLATIDVRFTEAGSEVYALRYAMVESDLGWRVDGAGALASIGSGA